MKKIVLLSLASLLLFINASRAVADSTSGIRNDLDPAVVFISKSMKYDASDLTASQFDLPLIDFKVAQVQVESNLKTLNTNENAYAEMSTLKKTLDNVISTIQRIQSILNQKDRTSSDYKEIASKRNELSKLMDKVILGN